MKTSLEIINKLSDKEAVKLESELVELGSAQEVDAESKRMTEKLSLKPFEVSANPGSY